MTLDELIAQTRARAGSLQPLDLLISAAQQQQELTELGEQLLDHFVQEARAAECPWSQIGAALGVTKQAAQQ
ncbi:MAG: Clp protease N-terminal domain-containing protein, partial [Pseudonocardiaceae bacterium]